MFNCFAANNKGYHDTGFPITRLIAVATGGNTFAHFAAILVVHPFGK